MSSSLTSRKLEFYFWKNVEKQDSKNEELRIYSSIAPTLFCEVRFYYCLGYIVVLEATLSAEK